MGPLPARFSARAAWWKVYLAVTPMLTASTAAGAGRRLGTTVALWTLPAGPVLGAFATWMIVRVRRGYVAQGLDPVVATTARDELNERRVPEDPAVREAARQLLPGMIEQQRRIERRYALPICVLAAIVTAVLAPVTGEWGYLYLTGVAVVSAGVVRVTFGRYVRRWEEIQHELSS